MTNAEFLNKTFGTNYKAWMKCRWDYSPELKVWFIPFDGKVRFGWENKLVGDKVIERFVGLSEEKLESHKDFDENYRLVVDKAQNYKVLGVYQYDESKSNINTQRIWVKIASSLSEFVSKNNV